MKVTDLVRLPQREFDMMLSAAITKGNIDAALSVSLLNPKHSTPNPKL